MAIKHCYNKSSNIIPNNEEEDDVKSILIIGAGGFIGSAISEGLRTQNGRRGLLFGTSSSGKFGLLALDVTKRGSIGALTAWMDEQKNPPMRFDAVVYAAGHCPPGGYMAERSACDSDPRIAELYASGLSRAIAGLLSHIADNGRIVVMSHAIPDREASVSRGVYGGAKDSHDAMIYTLREDERNIGARGIRVHRIAPWAVEGSPYYEGTPEGLMPTQMIPVAQVVEAVKQALSMEEGYLDTDFFVHALNE